ncbi:MAG: serine/threonine-protein kinase [Rubripirellula sp.]|nr:serine/threonine-protein kinase [Rubripirellula sp.]
MSDSPTPPMAPLNGSSSFTDDETADHAVDLHLISLKSIAGFSVIRNLGQGGSSNVFLCEQLSPSRQVALKLLKLSQCDAHVQQRFQLEANLLATLEHPGIARIFETGLADIGYGPQPYYTMEYIDGERLDRFIESDSRKELPIENRIRIFLDIADAVNCAHKNDIVHRDLKPNNILVTESHDIKVIDFGLARLIDPNTTVAAMTRTGHVVGTPMYMSPEQFKSDRYLTDHRSDIYSLGLMLYEMVCGQKPYDIEDKALIEIAHTVTNQPPIPLGKVDPALRGDLATIIGKSLEKRPEDRYQSLEEMAQDLRLFASGQPINARRPTILLNFARWYRNHLNVALAGTVTALLLLLTTISALVSTASSHRREGEIRQQAQLLKQSYDELADANRELNESVYLAELSAVNRTLMRTGLTRNSNPSLTRSLLFDETLIPRDRRNFAWKVLERQSNWLITNTTLQRGALLAAAFSKDDSVVAIATENAIEVRNSSDSTIRFTVNDEISHPTLLAIGPRSNQIAFRKKDRQLVLYDFERDEKFNLCSSTQEPGHAVVFSPSGKLAIGVGKGQLRVWENIDAPPVEFQIANSPIIGLRFSTDETVLYATAADGTVKAIQPSDGSIVESIDLGTSGLQKAFVSPDGRFVAGGRSYHHVSVWDRKTGTRILRHNDPGARINCVLFGSTELKIGLGERNRVDLIYRDQKSTLLHLGKSPVTALCLSSDQSRILIGDMQGNAFIFRTAPPEIPRQISLTQPISRIVRFTDNQSLLLFSEPGNLDSYDARSGKRTRSLPQLTSRISDAEVTKDGSTVFFALTANRVKSWDLKHGAPGHFDTEVKERIVDFVLDSRQKQLIGITRAGSIWRFDLETNQSQLQSAGHKHRCSSIVHSTTEPVLFIADYQGDLSKWDANLLQLRKRQKGAGSRITELAVSPDGDVLAASCRDGIVRIYNTASLSLLTELTVHNSPVRSLDFSPDGTTLATGGNDSQMILWDTAAWQPQSVWDLEGQGIKSMRFSPNGKRLAVCGDHDKMTIWEIEPASSTLASDSVIPLTSN